MGFLSDIRSGKRDPDRLGLSAQMFWLCAGVIAGSGLAVDLAIDLAGHSEETGLAFVLAGATIGCCAGVAFGGTGAAASGVARAGWPLAAIGLLAGLS
jgi:predicted MFS family arabinose efflux permease